MPSYIFEMLIIGSNMGIIKAVKSINKYAGNKKKVIDLMKNE
jgi:hypothetical protein